MKNKFVFFIPFLMPVGLFVFFQVWPPRIGYTKPDMAPVHEYIPLIDSPAIKPLMRKQASNDSFRRVSRVKNFKKLDEIDKKLSESERNAHRAYMLTKIAAKRSEDSLKGSANKEPDSDNIAIEKEPTHKRSVWYRITHKNPCE